MKKLILFIALIATLPSHAQQNTFAEILGNNSQSQGYSIVKTFDNKYIIAGEIDNEAIVLKIDSTGSIIWSKKIGGNNNEKFVNLITTRDSCYATVGNIFNTIDSSLDIFCVKLNSGGDTLWTREINMGYNDYAYSIQQTYDNGYIITGYSSKNSSPQTYIDVVKLDINGNLLWGKSISGTNFNNYAYSVRQMHDSGYVILGYMDSLSVSGPETSLIKLTQGGNISWAKKQVLSSGYNTFGNDIIITRNDDLLCLLSTNDKTNKYCVLMKTDSSGNTLWAKKYNVYYYDSLIPNQLNLPKLKYITDNEYLLLAQKCLMNIDTNGNTPEIMVLPLPLINDALVNSNKGYTAVGLPAEVAKTFGHICIIKTDSLGFANGWECHNSSATATNTSYPINLSSVTLSDSLIAESVTSHPAIINDSLSVILYGCTIGGINENSVNENSVNIFPDPATDFITIESKLQVTIEILNIQGQLIKTLASTGNKTNIDVSAFPNGVYIVEVKTEKGVAVSKFIKE